MALSPHASGGQTLRTPPSSNPPKQEESNDRKRKRETPPAALDSTTSKRTRRGTSHILSEQIPTSPTHLPKDEPFQPLRLDDAPLSPGSRQGKEERSHRTPESILPQQSYQPQGHDPNINNNALDPAIHSCVGEGKTVVGEFSQEKDSNTDEALVAPASKSITTQQRSPGESLADPVGHWALDNAWPQEYFTQEHPMNAPLTKKRSSSSLRDPTVTTSDATDASAVEKPYRSPQFEVLLELAGIFMHQNPIEPSQSCKELCTQLLEADQEIPKDTLFQDKIFKPLIIRLGKENEAAVFRDMTPLIAPPAENLVLYGAEHLNILHGHVNMAWGRCTPLVAPPPQPDYCVGIDLWAFSIDQTRRLRSLIGGQNRNPLMATWMMYFPFFVCEVKASNADLNVADRQNISSGSVAVNTLIALYRAAGREKELHGKILAFSIAHNIEQFRIYGHYASFDEQVPRFYRYKIKAALFDTPEDRWRAYRFTRNVYDIFAPIHFERVCSVLNSLPENASVWGPELAFQQSEAGDSSSVQSSAPRAPDSATTCDENIQEPKNARSRKKK